MNLRLYHALPAPLRSATATLRGYQLRRWRYGPETERLITEAFERESWPPERWRGWQEDRLARLLHRAATQVPYYRAHWAERRRRGDTASWEVLGNWPVLDKEPLRANPRAFVAEDRNVRRLFPVHTSGTSGTPLTLWRSRETSVAWYALIESRLRRWNGVSRHDPWAILGGQPVVPPDARRPPFWVWNAALNQLYLSSNHVSRSHAGAYVAALERYRITHVIAYSSSAAVLAAEILNAGLHVAGVKVVLTNAEPLTPSQRDVIGRGFGAAVRETYGMVEVVAAASECAAGTFHLWPEVGWVEILDDGGDVPVGEGVTGRLACTGLLNPDMPLIRYLLGDRASLPAAGGPPCACGRALPPIGPIEGRTNDLLHAPDGRVVYWLNPVFYGLPVREAQIVQEALDIIRVRYVPAPEFSDRTAREICERLEARMGRVEVRFEPVEAIPRGPGGKFRAVVSLLASGVGSPPATTATVRQ